MHFCQKTAQILILRFPKDKEITLVYNSWAVTQEISYPDKINQTWRNSCGLRSDMYMQALCWYRISRILFFCIRFCEKIIFVQKKWKAIVCNFLGWWYVRLTRPKCVKCTVQRSGVCAVLWFENKYKASLTCRSKTVLRQ